MQRLPHPHKSDPKGKKVVTNTADNPALAWAELMLRLRREREEVFGKHLFADPCWDMLLDLYVALRRGRVISVSSLCVAAAVPASTALRWIEILVQQGLVLREPDPKDKRRILVVLTRKAETQLDHLFEKLRRDSPGPLAPSGPLLPSPAPSGGAPSTMSGGKHEARLGLEGSEGAVLQALAPAICLLLDSVRAEFAEALQVTAHGNAGDRTSAQNGIARRGSFSS